jgi:hypothetical protein
MNESWRGATSLTVIKKGKQEWEGEGNPSKLKETNKKWELLYIIPCLYHNDQFTQKLKSGEIKQAKVTQILYFGARSINTQFLNKCHILYYNYTSPYSEATWKQLYDKAVYTCQWKYLISRICSIPMSLNVPKIWSFMVVMKQWLCWKIEYTPG